MMRVLYTTFAEYGKSCLGPSLTSVETDTWYRKPKLILVAQGIKSSMLHDVEYPK